jgi:hypothetical protein
LRRAKGVSKGKLIKWGIITSFNSWIDWTWKTAMFLVLLKLILPTPKKVWIKFNTAKSLLCNSMAKVGLIDQPILFFVWYNPKVKQDSASENPVIQ